MRDETENKQELITRERENEPSSLCEFTENKLRGLILYPLKIGLRLRGNNICMLR